MAWTALQGGQLRRRPLPLFNGDYRRYYAAMRDAIRDGAALPVTAAEALAVMILLEKGQQSAARGARIALQPIR